MIPTPLSPYAPPTPAERPPDYPAGSDPGALLWIDQFNQNVLLTVQAFQRLHEVFNFRFPGGNLP